MRQRWGLAPAQRISPVLEDKVLFTVTATGTYEQAAAVAGKWGSPLDDSTIHTLVQRLGARAEAQTDQHGRVFPPERPAGAALAPAETDPAHQRRGD